MVYMTIVSKSNDIEDVSVEQFIIELCNYSTFSQSMETIGKRCLQKDVASARKDALPLVQ